MLISADQLVAHLVGDYVFQSDWMASEKTKKSVAALAHVVTYTLPFLFLTTSWKALLFVAGTHFLIDRWRLARYVCWAKNFLQPKIIEVEVSLSTPIPPGYKHLRLEGEPTDNGRTHKVMLRNYPWSECVGTGYHKDRPAWMAVWLMIIADNTMHVILNGLALKYLA